MGLPLIGFAISGIIGYTDIEASKFVIDFLRSLRYFVAILDTMVSLLRGQKYGLSKMMASLNSMYHKYWTR